MTFECASMCNVHIDANLSVDLQTIWLWQKHTIFNTHSYTQPGCHLTSFSGRKNDSQHLSTLFYTSTLSFQCRHRISTAQIHPRTHARPMSMNGRRRQEWLASYNQIIYQAYRPRNQVQRQQPFYYEKNDNESVDTSTDAVISTECSGASISTSHTFYVGALNAYGSCIFFFF